ncbi:hypothetical protein FY048_01430 [Acinetobacter sp. 1124_18A]|uniref:hypothetical protein n=1 Tax=Acinetobacter sp. 1124_18A TaxID=2605958 RepID=UPI004059EB66
MTDLNKLRSEFEAIPEIKDRITRYGMSFVNESYDSPFSHMNEWMNGAWFAWELKAKAQAVLEHIVTLQRNGEVFKFDLLDLLRRSLKSSKVLKTRENWSHVSKMVGIGSTTSTLLCKEMNVDPDGTVFEASESGAEK